MNVDDFFELPLYFVRHNMSSNIQTYDELISEGRIAFHYEYDLVDGVPPETFEPHHYKKKSNQDLFKRLKNICTSGAIIAADFSQHHPDIPAKMLMGIIVKDSDPYKIITPKTFKESNNKIGTYKTIKLKDPHIFSYVKYRELQTLQAGKRGNLNRWEKSREIRRYIKNLYAVQVGIIDSMPDTVYALTPSQLEVLCSEYLRKETKTDLRLDYLLSPIGRGRKDIDVDGMSGEKLILAQVSMSNNKKLVEEKIQNLLGYSKDTPDDMVVDFVYFGPESEKSETASRHPEIIYTSIEDVFKKMKKTGIIDYMLNR